TRRDSSIRIRPHLIEVAHRTHRIVTTPLHSRHLTRYDSRRQSTERHENPDETGPLRAHRSSPRTVKVTALLVPAGVRTLTENLPASTRCSGTFPCAGIIV